MKSLVFILSLFALAACNPDKDEIINTFVKNIESEEFISYSTTITLSDYSKGTNYIYGKCSFKKAPKDTLIGYYYHFKSGRKTKIYSGDELLENVPEDYGDSIVSTLIKKNSPVEFSIQEFVMNNQKFYAESRPKNDFLYDLSIIDFGNEIKGFQDSTPYKILTDTIINNYKCRRLMFVGKDTMINKGREYFSFTFGFDKETNMLIYYRRFATSQEQDATQETTVFFDDFSYKEKQSENLFSRKFFPASYKFMEAPPSITKEIDFIEKNNPAPLWELHTINEKLIRLEDLKGKPVFLIFSKIGCVPCMLALPDLNSIVKEFKDITVLGIYPRDNKETLVKYSKNKGIIYDILYNSREAADKYGVTAYPTLFLIDKKGIIRYSSSGYGEGIKKEWVKEIKKVLKM